MKKLKNLVYRFFILCTGIGLLISYNSCISDQKDKDLILAQTFLERHDGTTWTVIEEDMRTYVRLNDDMDKALELWTSELELAKLMVYEECYNYSHEMLNTEVVEVLENSPEKLSFTHLGTETWTFSRDGERLKLVFETSNNARDPIYYSKTTENVNKLPICAEEKSKGNFDWGF